MHGDQKPDEVLVIQLLLRDEHYNLIISQYHPVVQDKHLEEGTPSGPRINGIHPVLGWEFKDVIYTKEEKEGKKRRQQKEDRKNSR